MSLQLQMSLNDLIDFYRNRSGEIAERTLEYLLELKKIKCRKTKKQS